MTNLGLFRPNPDSRYPKPTTFVLHAVVRTGVARGAHYHPEIVRGRAAKLLQDNPDHIVIIRLDYHETYAVPRQRDMEDWWARAAWAINWDVYRIYADRVIFFAANEPQLSRDALKAQGETEDLYDWAWCADLYNGARFPHAWGQNFQDLVAYWVPGAGAIPTPLACFHPDAMGASAPPRDLIEAMGYDPDGAGSPPWITLYLRHGERMQANVGGLPAHNLHGYGDPDPGDPPHREPETDHTRSAEGWRFGLNIYRDYRTIHDYLGAELLPIWITETNTAARFPATNPKANYPNEWLISATTTPGAILGPVEAVVWFVGNASEHGGEWSDFALDEIPAAQANFEWLKAHGW